MWRRRRRAILLVVLLLMTGFIGVKVVQAATHTQSPSNTDYLPSQVAGGAQEKPPTQRSTPSSTPESGPTVVDKGTGKWTYAEQPGKDATFGKDGDKLAYNVAVEGGIGGDAEDFSEIVTGTLSDKRGWTADGKWRFTQVGGKDTADFTVYLASPKTRETLCGAEDTYTSCRNGNAVVVNLERWLLGVPHWTESLASYRQYVINHEVGHRLGEGHVTCAKKGTRSPVMAQQTIKLAGCKSNAWPYIDGKYVTGPAGEYL